MEISVKDLYAVAEATKAMAAKMRESADSAEKMAKAVQTMFRKASVPEIC